MTRVFARLFSTLLVVGCLSAAACRRVDYHAGREFRHPLQVVCTTGMVADMIANLGGRHVAVQALMGPGVDPHLYKATPADVARLTSADVVFYNGLHLEGRLSELLEKLHRWKPAFAVTEELRERESHIPTRPASSDGIDKPSHGLRLMEGTTDVYDPHVWFDVALWARCAEYAARKLIELDPAHAAEYRQNADRYLARLADLDAECKRRLAEIPKDRRVLITAHDAFGYFGDAYDVEVRGLQGMSTVAEADLSGVNDIIDLLVARGIKAVFVESSVPTKNIRALVEGCAARGHRVVIGGELFSDALGPPGTTESDYVGMVRHNLNTIVEALK